MGVKENSDTRVLVTGASGYLASHCVKQLLESGYTVRGTVRSLKNPKKVQPLQSLQHANERLELVEADLEKDDGSWGAAVKGCKFVLHTASPFPIVADESIIPVAVNGTLAVLNACAKESSVEKVVLTSSVAAVVEGHDHKKEPYTEADWSSTDPAKAKAYPRSKTEAEKAAWNFMENISENDNKFALTCINPGLIIGPVLIDTECSSILILKQFLNNEMPAIPSLNIPLVDVRDVADAHILAMTNSESNGERIITVSQPSYWFKDIATVLEKEFKPQGYCLPRFTAPNFLVHVLSLFDSQAKEIVSKLGKEEKFDNSKANRILGINFRNPDTALIEMGYSMIERGMIPKKSGYKKRNFD